MEGLDADLLRLFTAEKNLALRFVAVDEVAQLYAGLANGEGQIAAGGLLRPPPGARPDAATAAGGDISKSVSGPSSATLPRLRWTGGYYIVEPVLIYNTDGFKPANWGDLDDETVAFSDSAGLDAEIAAVRKAHPAVVLQSSRNRRRWTIARVSGGEIITRSSPRSRP
jgi:membrane-bound lytic murein transglycosylase MltF